MRFLKDRNQFKENKLLENFNMSGEGSGPLGNDINWGDSLVGRLLNSIARKAKIGIDVKRIETISKRIQSEFDDLLSDAISRTSDSNSSTMEFIKISYLLGDLRTSVVEGRKVKFLIQQTESIINEVKPIDVSIKSGGKYEISKESKDDLLKQLNDFLDFLKQFNKEEGEKGLSEDVTGLKEGEDPSKTEFESKESNKSKEGLKYIEMISLLKSLKQVIDNKDNVKTFSQGEKESSEKSKNINYVLNQLIIIINESVPGDKKFANDLLSKSKEVKWPVLEVKGNSIFYRKSKKLIELTEDGKLMVDNDETFRKTLPEKTPKGEVIDYQSKLIIIDNKQYLKLDFNKKNIKSISKYILRQLNEIQSVINSEKNLKLNKQEVKWFNQNIKGKWLVIPSKKRRVYKTQIGDCDTSGNVRFLTPPVKGQVPTNINTILSKGVIFKDKSSADKFYNEEYESGKTVLSNKGKVSKKDTSFSQKDLEGTEVFSGVEDSRLTKESTYSVFQSLSFIVEKTILSGGRKVTKKDKNPDLNANEDYLNQSLSKLKSQISSMEKDGGVNSKFLNDIISRASDKGENEQKDRKKLENTKVIKLFLKEIKDSYNKIGDIGKLFNESIEAISDISQRKKASDKIARFAKFSMQLEGENMYGGLGEIGEPIKEFNKLFKKLLNTKFEEKKQENTLLNYKSFLLIKEAEENENIEAQSPKTSKTSVQIREYFFKNMDYDRWVIEKTEVEKIKRNVEESSNTINEFGYDHILEIVKLFNKAYKIYTTPTIPSGREGGKVSNKTFREYTYLGSGSPGTLSDPGYGPWRNNKVFDRFEDAIQDIKKSDEYKPIFSAETNVVFGDGTVKKGGGKILLKFIEDLLDGDSLYKTGAQKKFMEKYFNLKVEPKEIGINRKDTKDDKSTSDIADDVVSKEKKFIFKKVNKIENITRSLYVIEEGSKKDFYYMLIITEDEKSVYVKMSKSFSQIGRYYKENDIKISKGDITRISTQKRDLLFGKIDKSKFDLNIGDKLDVSVFSFQKLSEDRQRIKQNIEKKEINIRNIYTLKDEKGDLGKLGRKDKTSYGKEDNSDYKNLKEVFK